MRMKHTIRNHTYTEAPSNRSSMTYHCAQGICAPRPTCFRQSSMYWSNCYWVRLEISLAAFAADVRCWIPRTGGGTCPYKAARDRIWTSGGPPQNQHGLSLSLSNCFNHRLVVANADDRVRGVSERN